MTDVDGIIRGIIIFYVIGLIIGITRIIIRTIIARRPGIEEILMGVSMLFWTGDVVLSTVLLRKGTNQLSDELRASLTEEEKRSRELGSKSLLAAWFCYVTFIWGAKTCLLLFYRRLMQRISQIKIVKMAAALLIVTYVATILSMFLVCRPFKGNWQVVPDPGPACTDGYVYVWVIGILNILTDGVLLLIPIPVMLKLQISNLQKCLLVLLFGSGLFVMIATALRIHFTIGGDVANLTFWCMIETTSAMVVVNAPGIVSLYGYLHRNSSSVNYELRNNSNLGQSRSRPTGAGGASTAILSNKFDGKNTTICERGCNTPTGRHVNTLSNGKLSPLEDKFSPNGYAGDSTERIIVADGVHDGERECIETEKGLVIHQKVSYAVTEEYKHHDRSKRFSGYNDNSMLGTPRSSMDGKPPQSREPGGSSTASSTTIGKGDI